MIKRLLLLLFMLNYILSGANAQKAIIKGKFIDLKEPVTLMVAKFEGRTALVIHKEEITTPLFKFEIDAPSEEITPCMLTFQGRGWGSSYQNIYLKPGATYDLRGKPGHAWNLKLTSEQVKEQEYETEYINSIKEYEIESSEYSNQLRGIALQMMNTEDKKVLDEFQKKADALSAKIRALDTIMYGIQFPVLAMQPYSYVKRHRLSMFAQVLDSPFMEDYLNLVYNSLPDKVKEEEWAKEINVKLNKTPELKIGDLVDARLKDLQGNTVELSSFRGKYVLLDFWADSCAPCLKAIPELEEISSSYAQVLQVVSISLESDEMWRRACEKHRINWTNLNNGQSKLSTSLRVNGIPAFFLISPEGKLLACTTGYGNGHVYKFLRDNKVIE